MSRGGASEYGFRISDAKGFAKALSTLLARFFIELDETHLCSQGNVIILFPRIAYMDTLVRKVILICDVHEHNRARSYNDKTDIGFFKTSNINFCSLTNLYVKNKLEPFV